MKQTCVHQHALPPSIALSSVCRSFAAHKCPEVVIKIAERRKLLAQLTRAHVAVVVDHRRVSPAVHGNGHGVDC
jgi:hypothetical protein